MCQNNRPAQRLEPTVMIMPLPRCAATTDRAVPSVPVTHNRTFPGVAASVPDARHWLAGLLDGLPGAADAALCLSELATNAIQHVRHEVARFERLCRLEVPVGTT